MRKFKVNINNKVYEVEIEECFDSSEKKSFKEIKNEIHEEISREVKNEIKTTNSGNLKIKAPMPGVIVNICVKVGQSVKAGEILFILEAMKMENEILASKDGIIKNILVQEKVNVNSGDILAEFE